MPQLPNSIDSASPSRALSERELVEIGLTPRGNGVLTTPGRITLTPTGEFYRLIIELPGGATLAFGRNFYLGPPHCRSQPRTPTREASPSVSNWVME